MITRRAGLTGIAAVLTAPLAGASAAETQGGAATAIKIGNTQPYSGPASSKSTMGRAEQAFLRRVNDGGGVGGHKVDFLSLDDSYSPPKTVEQTRRLVEQDRVAFLFGSGGTPTNSAIVRYCNQNKVPQLFVASGADKWGDYKDHPWTIGWQPSYRTEAQIYAKYLLAEKPDAKLAILYQNDDFGRDYPAGVRDVLGKGWDRVVIKTATYEAMDPTIDSQITALQSSGADALLVAAIPKAGAQSIRKVRDLNWNPVFFLCNISMSVGGVMRPAGPQNGIGIMTALYSKDPSDQAWDNDRGMADYRRLMTDYLPGADPSDGGYVDGYGLAYTMWKTLQQCGSDFSRENVLKQATNLKDLEVPTLLPGIRVNTSPTDYHPIRAMQLARWNGRSWVRFGEVIEGAAT